jgi:hypothetical protein
MNSSASSSLSSTAGTATAYNASVQNSPTMDSYVPEVAEAGITVPSSSQRQKISEKLCRR